MRPGQPIDLHCHSTASDGALAPAAVVERAAAAGVTTLALTDHDTVAGLDQAAAAARTHGIALVAGVEISVAWQRRTLHVVGLALDPAASALVRGLATQQAARAARAEAIAARLARLGEADVLDDARAQARGADIGRLHFARALVERGRCKTVQAAFKRYLRPGRPAHVRAAWADPETAVGWIRAAGGLAVLAHPFGYGFTGAWRRRAVAALAAAGGHGIESATGTTDTEQEAAAERDAREHGLAVSIGSDFHAPEQHWLGLGRLRSPGTGTTPVWALPEFAPLR